LPKRILINHACLSPIDSEATYKLGSQPQKPKFPAFSKPDEPNFTSEMMRSHAVKFEERFPVSRDNTEIQELLNLHDTKDLNNLSLLGNAVLQSSSDPALSQAPEQLSQGYLTILTSNG
jgi:hypothetical protein